MKFASEKQISFLKSLLEDRALDFSVEAIPEILSPSVASYWISECLKCPRKPRESKPRVDVDEGFYQYGKSEIAVVKFNRAKTNKYAMRLTTTLPAPEDFNLHPGEDFDQEDYDAWQRRNTSIEWVYEPGLITRISREGWQPMTLEEAKAFGALYGVCMVCGRTLTNPASIAAGIGPVCAGRF